MNLQVITDTAQDALFQVILIGGPILLISVIVGLGISIVQTAFSIQEQTLTFVPKIIAILATIALLSTWMATQMSEYTFNLFTDIPVMVRENIEEPFQD